MRTVVFVDPYRVKVKQASLPEIKTGEDVLIKVKRVGICGTDMHMYHGANQMGSYPRIFGHELCGEVEEVGAAITHLSKGDRVVVDPVIACGTCYACKKNRPNVCRELSVYGVHEDGGCQDHIVLPSSMVHKADPKLDWEELVMAEPYTIGAQAVSRGGVSKGDTVLVQGAGPIGICILKMAKLHGATVFVSDINKSRLAFAEQSGADLVIDASEGKVVPHVMRATDGAGVNVVIDAVCLPQTFSLGLEVASVAGSVVVLSFDVSPSAANQSLITKKELNVVGSRLHTNQFPYVLEQLSKGLLTEGGLITHRFSVNEAESALEQIDRNKENVRKAIIAFS